MPVAEEALASGRVTALDSWFDVHFGPGVTKPVRVLLAEPSGRQPILFLAIDGFFHGVSSPYETPDLAADTLAFALALDALFAAATAGDLPFVWAAEWQTVPALLLLGARHVTALHLHSASDAWLGPALAHFTFPGADRLAHATALRAGFLAADIVASANPGFTLALRDPLWPIYHRVLAPHLQDVCGRMETVASGPLTPVRPDWIELAEALAPDSHRAGTVFAGTVLPRRAALLPKTVRRPISSRMIVLVGGRNTTQHVPEVPIAAAQQVLAAGNFPGYFVFALGNGDEFGASRRKAIEALRERFPNDVLIAENDPVQIALMREVANVEVFARLWEPHGRVFHGPTVPVAFGEGPGAQIRSGWARGRGAGFQAKFHREDEPRSGWWLFPHVTQPAHQSAENWRALLAGPPSAPNRVFESMVGELATALQRVARLWSEEPISFAAVVLAALRQQDGGNWNGRDGFGRMFELVERVRGRPGSAA